MKIHDRPSVRGQSSKERPAAAKNVGTRLFSLFTDELKQKQIEVDNYGSDIETLREQINFTGERLENEPTLKNFKEFRELLSRLAKRISNEAYRLEKIGGTPSNPRYYEVIKIIDKEADKLYELIVKEQKNRMAITAAVIGIKGLVVDLTT